MRKEEGSAIVLVMIILMIISLWILNESDWGVLQTRHNALILSQLKLNEKNRQQINQAKKQIQTQRLSRCYSAMPINDFQKYWQSHPQCQFLIEKLQTFDQTQARIYQVTTHAKKEIVSWKPSSSPSKTASQHSHLIVQK